MNEGNASEAGERFGYVGEIMDPDWTPHAATVSIVNVDTLPETPGLPAPGIYFGMADDDYHALPALSNSGIKKLAASPMIFWAATPWLSKRRAKLIAEAKEKGEREHFTMGKAYHCRIMEGPEAFASRFAVLLDPADYPDALESTDQIKAAIATHEVEQPVAPRGNKPDLVDQLADLHRKANLPLPYAMVEDGKPFAQFADGSKIDVAGLKERIGQFSEAAPVKPVSKVMDPDGPDGEPYERSAVKADWIAQLMALDPDASVFANIDAEHRAQHEGKTFLTIDQFEELEIAAKMVEADPELREAFRNGFPEVTLIWNCPQTGVPMKARVDYMQIDKMVDLKSVGNQRERSIENAIRFEIAAYKYNLQPVVYFEGAEIVRGLVRQQGAEAVFTCSGDRDEQLAFATHWAKHEEPDKWLWVFQQKGAAPITRGVWFPRGGDTDLVTKDIIAHAKRTFRTCAEVFGTDPWLDIRPSYTIADEEIPASACEI
jgi:hypothetical protein